MNNNNKKLTAYEGEEAVNMWFGRSGLKALTILVENTYNQEADPRGRILRWP
jgi:hypothetical protein